MSSQLYHPILGKEVREELPQKVKAEDRKKLGDLETQEGHFASEYSVGRESSRRWGQKNWQVPDMQIHKHEKKVGILSQVQREITEGFWTENDMIQVRSAG